MVCRPLIVESLMYSSHVCRSLVYLFAYDLLLLLTRTRTPRTLLRLTAPRRPLKPVEAAQPASLDIATVNRVIRSVEIACALYVRPILCLPRSTVLCCLLRRHGIPATVVIGYRQPPFESHAWVEVAGRVVGDQQAYRRRFHVIDVLPSSLPS
jgi:hypothetical protein